MCLMSDTDAITSATAPFMAHPPLTDYPIFSTLDETERATLRGMATERSLRKHHFVYNQGDEARHVYFVASGEVKLGNHGADGREIIRNVLRPNAMFGQLAISGEATRDGFAQSLSADTVVYQLPTAGLQTLMQGNFGLCQLVLQNVTQQLQLAQHRLTSVVSLDARTRIVNFLKESVAQRGKRVGLEYLIRHSLTHQDIANLTCTSRQTVTLVLNELRKANLIYFNRGKILVRDVAALA